MTQTLLGPSAPTDRIARTVKSANAFRTISEVADELDVAQHVLRFWESKFPQVRPLKRGGGRRYYRPEDIDLLRRIRSLLYDEGYTIKGVQKLLRVRRRGVGGEGGPTAPAASGSAAETAVAARPEALSAGGDRSDPASVTTSPVPATPAERQRALADLYADLCALADLLARMRDRARPTLSDLPYGANHSSARSVAQPG